VETKEVVGALNGAPLQQQANYRGSQQASHGGPLQEARRSGEFFVFLNS
jgi:hypothetical protein